MICVVPSFLGGGNCRCVNVGWLVMFVKHGFIDVSLSLLNSAFVSCYHLSAAVDKCCHIQKITWKMPWKQEVKLHSRTNLFFLSYVLSFFVINIFKKKTAKNIENPR